MDFAVVGQPVGHSRSPEMHAAAYRSLGLDFVYGRREVAPGSLESALLQLATEGVRGVNVTVPLKEEAAALPGFTLEGISARTGAVNTLDLVGRRALNTDGPGLVLVLERFGIKPGASVALLGAGGTSRSFVVALEEAGFVLSLWNRTPERAEKLVSDLGALVKVNSVIDVRDADVVINATSASMDSAELPISWQDAKPDALMIDAFYAVQATPFVRSASERGLRALDGRELLAAQGALSFAWWLGGEPPIEAMRASLNLNALPTL